MWWDGCDWGWGWHGWGMGLMGILWFVLSVVAAVAVVRWIARTARSSGTPAVAGKSALDLLKERYARGEISNDEFTRVKRDIE